MGANHKEKEQVKDRILSYSKTDNPDNQKLCHFANMRSTLKDWHSGRQILVTV